MSSDAPTAFFSYSREDSEFALRLAEDLKAAGANVWLDQLDIQPGQRWARAIEDALNNSPRVLVILSPAAVKSTNVEDEVAFALDERKAVIPVFYRDCKVPFQLRPFQYVDFRSDYEHGLKVLLRTIGAGQRSLTTAAAKSTSPVPAQGDVASAVADAGQQAELAEETRAHEEQERKAAAEKKRLVEQRERERQAAAEASRLAEQKRVLEEQERKAAAEKKRLVELQEQERQAAAEASRLAEQKHVLEEQERKAAAEKRRLVELQERERQAAEEAPPPDEKHVREERERQAAAEKKRREQERLERRRQEERPDPLDQVFQAAANQYRRSAGDGDADGMYWLGYMYETGRGVEKDQQQAISWYRQSALLLNEKAVKALERLGVEM